ncbi:MAG: DeoR/GlpR family DNA-binding transcription regulator [Planctomycetota bacterium]
MIALQRHRKILNRVIDEGSARVSVLARELGVTEETIRRDLRTLSEQGMLARTHGGAVALERQDVHLDLPYDQRHATNPFQKEAISRAAVRLIKPGQVIALDPSSTACQLARLIPDIPLTVVTNSLVVCTTLSAHPQIQVICTGGTLDPEAMAFFGLHTQRALESLNVERLFFSCRGLDLDRGLSEANDRHAAVKLSMIGSAHRSTLLADTSKLGLASTVFYASVDVAEHIIVNRPEDKPGIDAVERLRKRGVRVDEADLIQDQPKRA